MPDLTPVQRHQIHDQLESIARYIAGRKSIEKRLLALIDRDQRGGDSTADGFPTSTMGGSRGGSTSTSVEAAVLTRANTTGDADEIHHCASTARDMLDQAARSMGAVMNLLARAEQVTGSPIEVVDCELCEPAGIRHPWAKYARDLIGLPAPMHLCQPGYDYIAKHGNRPTDEQIQHHDRTGRWKIRIGA